MKEKKSLLIECKQWPLINFNKLYSSENVCLIVICNWNCLIKIFLNYLQSHSAPPFPSNRHPLYCLTAPPLLLYPSIPSPILISISCSPTSLLTTDCFLPAYSTTFPLSFTAKTYSVIFHAFFPVKYKSK